MLTTQNNLNTEEKVSVRGLTEIPSEIVNLIAGGKEKTQSVDVEAKCQDGNCGVQFTYTKRF